jgi:hypothetical protein
MEGECSSILNRVEGLIIIWFYVRLRGFSLIASYIYNKRLKTSLLDTDTLSSA